MKTTALLLIAAALLTGCASSFRLPAVAGKTVHYERKDSLGGTVIDAKDVAVTAEKVTAGEVIWTTTYPQFSVSLHVVGYERQRTAKGKAFAP